MSETTGNNEQTTKQTVENAEQTTQATKEAEVIAQEIQEIVQEISGSVTKNRKRLLGFGILSIILGFIGTSAAVFMTMTSMILFGMLIVIGGFVFLVESFSAPERKGKLWHFLIALLYILAGATMIINPAGSAVWFTLFIASFLIVIGIMRIVMGFQIKNEVSQWGLMVLSGTLSIILGFMISAQWPISGLWVIGLFISTRTFYIPDFLRVTFQKPTNCISY